jgi:hypothetical protein
VAKLVTASLASSGRAISRLSPSRTIVPIFMKVDR